MLINLSGLAYTLPMIDLSDRKMINESYVPAHKAGKPTQAVKAYWGVPVMPEKLLDIGDRVESHRFGPGVLVSVYRNCYLGEWKYIFSFDAYPDKPWYMVPATLLDQIINLKKVKKYNHRVRAAKKRL